MAPTSRNQQRPPRRQRSRRRTSAAVDVTTRPAMAEALARGLGCDSAPMVGLRRR